MNTDLAAELVEMARIDQEYRHQWFNKRDDPTFLKGMERMDDAHAVQLKKLFKHLDGQVKNLSGLKLRMRHGALCNIRTLNYMNIALN